MSGLPPKTKTFPKFLLAIFALVLAGGLPAQAQYFKVLYNFQGSRCPATSWTLTQGRDTNLYGALTACGIFSTGGSIYRVTPGGTIANLHSFLTADLEGPSGPLTLATDGNFFGVTHAGGAYSYGSFYRVTPDGSPTNLHDFTGGSDGAWPYGALVRTPDNSLYGTALLLNLPSVNYSLFKIGADNQPSTVCSLDVNNSPGSLVLGKDGNFYGVAGQGTQVNGTVFKKTPAGQCTILYTFDGVHGAQPGTLITGPDANLYGTTIAGGSKGDGVMFKITPSGVLTVLHEFDHSNPLDGSRPGTLLLASDGNFYGTTFSGGLLGYGMIYRINRAGNFLALHHFNKVNGASPMHLMQHTNGKMFGGTSAGGPANDGVLFWFDWALKPFVKLEESSGRVGSTVGVIGNGFNSTLSVTFNGVPASYVVEQDGYLTATVPNGATTGYVQVVTASGAANSNTVFKVTP